MTRNNCRQCQGPNRHTSNMVCMTCGRDYLSDNPVPGLGWKRLMEEWRAKALELHQMIIDNANRTDKTPP